MTINLEYVTTGGALGKMDREAHATLNDDDFIRGNVDPTKFGLNVQGTMLGDDE